MLISRENWAFAITTDLSSDNKLSAADCNIVNGDMAIKIVLG